MGSTSTLGKYLGHISNHNTMDKRHPSTRTYSEGNKSESRGNTAKVSVMRALSNSIGVWHPGYPSSNTSIQAPAATPMNVITSLHKDQIKFQWNKILCKINNDSNINIVKYSHSYLEKICQILIIWLSILTS